MRLASRLSRILSAAALASAAAPSVLQTPARAASDISTASVSSVDPVPSLVERVKRAVVAVDAFDERGRPVSRGSGFFIREGLIVTNLHVVGRAARVEVTTYGGGTRAVEGVAAFDRARDLALLRAGPAPSGRSATLSTADRSPAEGEEIFVVSNPRGSPWEVSRGKALAPWVSPDLGRLVPFTAAVARGSSGGPVVNLRGQVVGVATMGLRADGERFFAVPGEEVAGLCLRLRAPMPFPLEAGD